MNRNNENYTFLFVTLGLLTAFGPFVTDFYLPALPALADYFRSSASMAQMSLTTGMFGLAVGQVFIGPISDRYGRRMPLLVSMAAFIVATALCIVAPNIYLFNLLRLFQGFTAAGGIVLARSIATDMYTGNELTRFIAMISAVNGVAPVVAPVVGGMLLDFTSWKGTFVLLLLVGAALAVLCSQVRESLPVARRSARGVLSAFAAYGKVFRNPKYVAFLAAYASSMLVLFAYISASPFILQQGYGLSPLAFGLCFAANAVGIGVGCAVAGRFADSYRGLRIGGGASVFMAIVTAAALWMKAPIAVVEPAFFLLMFAFGMIQPAGTSIVLDCERDNAGAASAALGASGFLMGGIVSPLVGIGDVFVACGAAVLLGAVSTAGFIRYACRRWPAAGSAGGVRSFYGFSPAANVCGRAEFMGGGLPFKAYCRLSRYRRRRFRGNFRRWERSHFRRSRRRCAPWHSRRCGAG